LQHFKSQWHYSDGLCRKCGDGIGKRAGRIGKREQILHNFFTTTQYLGNMTSRKLFLTGSLVSAFLLIAGCTRFVGPRLPPTPDGAPPPTNTARATSLPVTLEATPPHQASRTPIPTVDFVSQLVTLAYQSVTLTPRAPELPATTAVANNTSTNAASFPTATATLNPAPASVVFSEPIQIANAVSTADCKIRKVGDCTPVMPASETLFFTWTFGVKGEGTFQWGQAAIAVTRDGETIQWTQTGNGLARPPNPDKNESWTLLVGQSAKFAGGLENAKPGYYTARLMMCLLSMNECNEGQGWQPVGGESINFLVTP